jgi:hypothetical protein
MATQHPDEDIVRLATAPNPAQAHIWQQALQQGGIQCKVVGDYLNAGFGDIPGLNAELWVHRDDLEKAKELLAQGQDVTTQPPSEEDEE